MASGLPRCCTEQEQEGSCCAAAHSLPRFRRRWCCVALVVGYVWWIGVILRDRRAKVSHIFVQIADPQLGMLNQRTNQSEKDWETEFDMLARLVNVSVKLQPKPNFIFVGGDMQNFLAHKDGNLTIDGQDLGFHQRQDVKKALEVAKHHGIPLHYTAGEHDLGDVRSSNGVDTNMYVEHWGPHHEVVLNESGILYLQLNSELYSHHGVKSLKLEKYKQNAWLDEQLERVTAHTKLLVIMTHRPPFIYNMDERGGWGNWRKKERIEAMTKIMRSVKQGTPILWVCGHFHGNVRSASWYKGRTVHVRVSSAAGTTMQWQGKRSFSPHGAAAIAGKTFQKAIEEDLEEGDKSSVKERLQAVESRSGLRIFKTFVDGSFEDQWFTLEELETKLRDRTTIDSLLSAAVYSPFIAYAAGAQGAIHVLPPFVCLRWYIIPFLVMWLAAIVLKVSDTYRSRRTYRWRWAVAMEFATHMFPLSVFVNSMLIEWWPKVRILHVHSDINLAWYAGLLYGARIRIRWGAWQQCMKVFSTHSTSPSLWQWVFIMTSIAWAVIFILVNNASTGRNSDVTLIVIPTIVGSVLMLLTDTERDAVCICFFSSFYIMGLGAGHALVIAIARGGDHGGFGALLSFLGVWQFGFSLLVNGFVRRGRRLPEWADGVKFLRFAELERRASGKFGKRQDLDEACFGNPVDARHIVIVSHPWLDPVNPDPYGNQFKEILEKINERLVSKGWRRWLEGPGDVLVFFDYSSLPQWPRTGKEEELFQRALSHMNTLFQTFDVLVVDEIPKKLELHGHHLTYYEKGWCWFESRQAWLAEKLERFSPEVIQRMYTEDWKAETEDWKRALRGVPELEDQLYTFPTEEKRAVFLESRARQEVPAKYFTNGRADFDLVKQLLEVAEQKEKLRRAIQAKSADEVQKVFAALPPVRDIEDSPQAEQRYCKEDLANEIFDDQFTSALHLAVAANSREIVELLYKNGAVPACNYSGDLPWEWNGFTRSSDTAHIALDLANTWSDQNRGRRRNTRGRPVDEEAANHKVTQTQAARQKARKALAEAQVAAEAAEKAAQEAESEFKQLLEASAHDVLVQSDSPHNTSGAATASGVGPSAGLEGTPIGRQQRWHGHTTHLPQGSKDSE